MRRSDLEVVEEFWCFFSCFVFVAPIFWREVQWADARKLILFFWGRLWAGRIFEVPFRAAGFFFQGLDHRFGVI